ncbi:DUF5723 family protein [Cytophaga aurantiaca]|uniref:DUF5723 family protein n=1 Tax=Cytophaga aurantiaca TaxID=29530 RepID=UPI0003752796|nr:DUF5723 family protein [Cytophaga aurantiaca]
MLVSKKILTIIYIFLLGSVSAFAQQEMTLQFLTWVPQAGYTDLTLQPDHYKKSIGVPFISSIQLYYLNPAFKYNGLVHDNVVQPNNVIPKLKKYNQLYSGGSIDLFSMRFKTEKTYFQVSLRDVWSQRFVYTSDLANLVWNGNASFAGKSANLNNIRVAMNYYRELAFGVTKSVNDRFIIGVRGKFLMGLTNVTTQDSKNTLYTAPDGLSLSGHSQFTLLTSGLINDDQIKAGDLFGFQNLGAAADVGGRYKFSDKFSIAANVTNLGFINWKKDVKNYRVNGDYTYTGYIMHDSADIANADWQNIVDTLETIFKPKEDKKSYKSWLTPTVYVSGNYLLRPDLNLYSSVALDIYHGVRPTFTLGATQSFGQRIQATLSYSLTPSSYFNLGGGFVVRGGPVQFYIVTDNIIGVFDPYAVKYANVRVGINLLMGKAETAD